SITWKRRASWSRRRRRWKPEAGRRKGVNSANRRNMAKLFIAGEQRDASDGGTTEIRNPASGDLVDRVAAAPPGAVDRPIDAADAAFKKWSAVPPPQRAEDRYKAAHLLKECGKDLARLVT